MPGFRRGGLPDRSAEEFATIVDKHAPSVVLLSAFVTNFRRLLYNMLRMLDNFRCLLYNMLRKFDNFLRLLYNFLRFLSSKRRKLYTLLRFLYRKRRLVNNNCHETVLAPAFHNHHAARIVQLATFRSPF